MFGLSMFCPDITIMVDRALKTNYLFPSKQFHQKTWNKTDLFTMLEMGNVVTRKH